MENFIMNLYERMDREKIQFDMVVHMRKQNDYVDAIRQMGGRVYELPRLTRNPIQNLIQLFHIVRDNRYGIVIRHTSNALAAPQLLAARAGGAYTICHSHNETDPQKLLHRLGRLLMRFAAMERFACSEKAGQWMYGRQPFRIIRNAIDIRRFAYRPEASRRIREEFNLGDRRVYGHIANFISSKNHLYLLQIYKEIAKLDENARFFCVGDGSLRAGIESEIRRLGLEDRVILTGIRKDAEDFLSCFDVFIFPSVFEGLPLTLIEAQAAGLPCLISDTITRDVVVSRNLVRYESIERTPDIWAREAAAMGIDADRNCQYEAIAGAGYDVEALAKWYEKYITGILGKE
ncbi:MAG: glycosyltransferase [Roseburia sp.]|nr:glycosyltransferase [Roseburia sp.]